MNVMNDNYRLAEVTARVRRLREFVDKIAKLPTPVDDDAALTDARLCRDAVALYKLVGEARVIAGLPPATFGGGKP